ncbi:hypothetical protein [Lentibacillus salicampi]|uniref:Uncharacterized protein n=1 Tax=Lentibacillus salicampi TaxID=175306 RepID=A0A4Y9ACS2_9BACI|nr:hypothetical protein [Lentibacillus salicampi]TFJ92720.1 hypothetical protein E4U82_10565 [Lentibacillus salicampi]
MSAISGIGIVLTLLIYGVALYIAYLVITVAVRYGIDHSELGKILKKKYGDQEKAEKFHPKDDLDKDKR